MEKVIQPRGQVYYALGSKYHLLSVKYNAPGAFNRIDMVAK